MNDSEHAKKASILGLSTGDEGSRLGNAVVEEMLDVGWLFCLMNDDSNSNCLFGDALRLQR